MLFRHTRHSDVFQRALRAAVAAHRPVTLRALLASHGEKAFANALADLSGRVIADALSMLAAPDRTSIRDRLPRAARQRLRDVESPQVHTSAYARPAAPSSPLFLLR